jgi:hypothetical protein
MNKRNLLTAGFLLCGLLISACGSDTNKTGQNTDPDPITQVIKVLLGTLKPKAVVTDVRKTLTRQRIDLSPTPILLVSVESRNAHATLSSVGDNRGIITWATVDGVSLSFDHGVLVATRGLGPDLMAANVSNVLPALRSASGSALRIHDYLDGEDQIRQHKFQCTYHSEGREALSIYNMVITANHIVETCNSSELGMANHYWISGHGRIWQSRQWVGAGLGYAFIQQLSR